MEKVQDIKQKLIKGMIAFLGVMLVCTMISRTIYNYLLPVVRTTKAKSGTIEIKYITSGKVGLDESVLKNSQVYVIPSIGGKVTTLLKQEGDSVDEGERLGTIKPNDYISSMQNKELEEAELQVEEVRIEREIENNQKECERLSEDYEKQKQVLADIDNRSELLTLQEQIQMQLVVFDVTAQLYEEGLAAKQSYEQEKGKLAQLERNFKDQKETFMIEAQKSIEKVEKELQELQDKVVSLESQQVLNSKKKSILDNKVLEETLIAPISGKIHTLNIAEGAYVERNEKLIVIIPDDVAYSLSFEVEEEMANRVKIGQQVSFKHMQRPYKANVSKKKFNEITGKTTISCYLEQDLIAKMDLEDKSYKAVSVEVSNNSDQYGLVISNEAIKTVYTNHYIFVVEESEGIGGKSYKVREVPVRVLEEGDYTSAIEATVNSDMQIVTSHLSELTDGQEVALE